MAAATMYVTPTGGGGSPNDGLSWANAFSEAEFEADLVGSAEAGDVYYIMGGTYTLDSTYSSSSRDGTGENPISIIGVKAGTTNEPPVYTDWATGKISGGSEDRPLFSCGSYYISMGDYMKVLNIEFTGSPTLSVTLLQAWTNSLFYNCKVTSGRGSGFCLAGGNGIKFIACEASGSGTTAFSLNSYGRAIYCYAHTCSIGYNAGTYTTVMFCVANSCTSVGITAGSNLGPFILNNTLYGCAEGIYGVDGSSSVTVVNNIIDGATSYGIRWTTQQDSNFYWNNHGDDTRNTDMWEGVATSPPHSDLEVTTGDPKFTNPGSDFSLQSDSPCLDAGITLALGVG